MTDTPEPLNTSTPEPLPEMTRHEASFHASVAGNRAAAEAAKQGTDPAHTAALGNAAAGGRQFGALLIPLPCAYSALAVPAMGRLCETHGTELSGLQNRALFIAAFAHPAEAHRLACIQADAAAVTALIALADQVALDLLYDEVIEAASLYCMEAFARLHGVKKPSPPTPETSPEPVAPIPAMPEMGSEIATANSATSPAPPPTTEVAPAGSSVSSIP